MFGTRCRSLPDVYIYILATGSQRFQIYRELEVQAWELEPLLALGFYLFESHRGDSPKW